MVSTINEFLFPILLFVCYYCTFAIVIYHQKAQSNATAANSQMLPNIKVIFDEDEALSDNNLVTESTEEVFPVVEESHPIEQSFPEVKQNKTPKSGQQNPLYTEAEAIIKNLNKRQSRQLCKPLGIQQKCGKVEKSLIFIKAEIRSLFKDDPERVMAVIQEKFPELISTANPFYFKEEKIAS